MLKDRIVLGTAPIGIDGRQSAFELLDEYVALGGTAFDSATVYSDWVPGEVGRSETVIGEWLKARGNRDGIRIITKGAHPIMGTTQPRLDPASIRADIDQSLRRLGTDRIDLWFLHKDDPGQPVAEIVGTLQDIQQQGKIVDFGCSNWKLPRLREALVVPGATFTSTQLLGNVFAALMAAAPDPTNVIVDAPLFHYAREHGIDFYFFSATAHGYFERLAAGKGAAPEYDDPAIAAAGSSVMALAEKHGFRPSEMILAALLQLAEPVHAIIGPRNIEQLRAAWKASELVVPPEVVRQTFSVTGMSDFFR